jgi:polysaccharide export outer membrane protein
MAHHKTVSPLLQFAAVGLLMALLAPAWGADGAAGAAPRDPYLINPGDVLQISVWKEPELDRPAVLVNPDGHIAFPLAGDILAEGKTVEQLRQELVEKLGRFIPDVVVTVAAFQLLGNKVYVLGQVNRPGEFPMNRASDVMQALGMAGGPNAFAKLDDILVLRRAGTGTQVAIPFRYSDVREGKRLQQNILLRAGDTVVVP